MKILTRNFLPLLAAFIVFTSTTSYLSAFDTGENWAATHPALVAQIEPAVATLVVDGNTSDVAKRFAELVHSDLRLHMKSLEETATSLRQHLGVIGQGVDWSKWYGQSNERYATAYGPMRFRGNEAHSQPRATDISNREAPPADQEIEVEVEANFADGKLIGLTFYGLNFAVSTLAAPAEYQPAAMVGQEFWKEAFSSQFESAHGRLSAKFQEVLPLQDFRNLIELSGLDTLPKLAGDTGVEVEALRWSTRLERSLPAALSAFYLARFEDGTYLPLQCEMQVNDSEFEILSFNSDFEIEFPAEKTESAERLLSSFLSGEPASVLEWFDPQRREKCDETVLKAFLVEVVKVLGDNAPPTEYSVTLEYVPGNRFEHIQTILPAAGTKSDSPILFTAMLEAGKLDSFYFGIPSLNNFVRHFANVDGLHTRASDFFRHLLSVTSDLDQAMEMFALPLQTKAQLEWLTQVRNEQLQEHGRYHWCDLLGSRISSTDNTIACQFELEFEKSPARVDVVFLLDAVNAKIQSIKFE